MMANGLDNVSETFKLLIFKAISTIRKSSKHPDSKAIQEYIIDNSASNKCNIPIDCDKPLKAMHRDVQGDNDKKMNRTYLNCNTRCINQYEQPHHCNTRCINQCEQPY